MTATMHHINTHQATIGDFFISTSSAMSWSQSPVQTNEDGATSTFCHLAFISDHALFSPSSLLIPV
jgi:hypothetical protein